MDGWGGLKRGGAGCRRSRPGEGAGLCYFYTELLVLSPKTPMQVCYEFLI